MDVEQLAFGSAMVHSFPVKFYVATKDDDSINRY